MFIASFHNTQRGIKPKAKPTVVEAPQKASLLTLPPPEIRFVTKAYRDTTLREIRAKSMERVAEVEAATRALVPNEKDRGMPMSAIITDVARQFGTTPTDIKGKCRARLIVAIRHHAMARIWVSQKDKISFPMLGRAFLVDHTTVINALRKTGVWTPGIGNKVPDDMIAKIFELNATGEYTIDMIATMCRCSDTFVRKTICARKKHEANQP